ncbi:hypothetical protein GORHZ_118_00640 [Gordonia rhizosphera NBRC 16068]|uniref:Mycothiol-dependent maleylpyruvate isomerase metal-binding domain-containing protein n=2 Tax=Gordonia rhizosphera TaxID=83341 RepID=K6WFB4_9ACTN|nr:hypothetical protein GORHZ_118_00640 [Gordonia rhizosphera NBRC 16068]
MNNDDIWAAIDDHRSRTADLLEALRDDEWRRASLCDGWTIRDVAAHLTLQQIRLRQALTMLPLVVRHPGGPNSVIHWSAKRKAQVPTRQLTGEIRAMVGSRAHNIGLTPREALIDILVHGQDIALPLDRTLPMSPEAAAEAAGHMLAYGTGWRSKVFQQNGLRGATLRATDIDWSGGTGPEVRGPMWALLLSLAGRRAALGELSGDGMTLVSR